MIKSKLCTGMLALLLCALAPRSYAATGCDYPASLDSFVDKIAGDFLTIADVNEFRCAIEKIEAELGTTPSAGYSTVSARLDELFIATGKSGGQNAVGGAAASENLILVSTAHGTKGQVRLGAATAVGLSSAYDEINVRLGIGTQSPQHVIVAARDGTSAINAHAAGTSATPAFLGLRARTSLSAPSAVQSGDELAVLQGAGYGATAYGSVVGSAGILARENFTDTAQGTYFQVALAAQTTTTPAIEMLLDTAGLRIGDGSFADTTYHVGLINSVAAITYEESTATPNNPTSSVQARTYIKGDKFVIQFNDAGTVRYKSLDLNGTGVTWVHSTTAP